MNLSLTLLKVIKIEKINVRIQKWTSNNKLLNEKWIALDEKRIPNQTYVILAVGKSEISSTSPLDILQLSWLCPLLEHILP